MLLTFHDLCAFLKADERTVLSLLEAGGVPPPVNIGNKLVRWVETDLNRWVQMGCPQFPPPTPEEITLIHIKYQEEKRHPASDAHAARKDESNDERTA